MNDGLHLRCERLPLVGIEPEVVFGNVAADNTDPLFQRFFDRLRIQACVMQIFADPGQSVFGV